MEALFRWGPRVLAVATFLGCTLLAPASFYWLDSGELTAAAARLGVSHPTGFPLYCITANWATWLPVGDIAFRLNLFSALCAAITVWAVCRLIAEVGEEHPSAIAGSLAAGATLAVSMPFLRHATIAEVYVPTAALLAVTLLFFHRVAAGGDARAGLCLALCAGLGLGVHSSFRLLMAVPLVALFAARLYRGARWPLLAPLLATLVGVAMHSYFPLRSATGRIGGVDWGTDATASSLWDHVTAQRIRDAFGDQMLVDNPLMIADSARTFAEQLSYGLGPLCLLAAIAGIGFLGRERSTRWLLAMLVVIAAGDALYSIWLNPMGLRDLQNGIPLALAAVILGGFGIAWFAQVLGRAAVYGGAVLGFIMVVPPALSSVPQIAAGRDDGARDWSARVLDEARTGTIAFVRSDSRAAGLMYLKRVEGARPDMAVLIRQHLTDVASTRAALAEVGIEASARPAATALQTGRPIGWEISSDPTPRGYRLVASAYLAGLSKAPTSDPLADLDLAAAKISIDAGDPIADRQVAHALSNLGRLAHSRGELDAAEALFRRAVATNPEHAEALVNLGVIASNRGNIADAAAVTERALAAEPNRVRALNNAARYRMALGEDKRAMIHAERAINVAPNNAESWTLAGILDARAGANQRARARLQRALALKPNNTEAQRAMALLVRQTQSRDPSDQ